MSKFNNGRPYHGSEKITHGRKEPTNEYNEKCKSKAKYGFTLVFKLYCEKCGLSDFVKISNTGWQGGKHSQTLERA